MITITLKEGIIPQVTVEFRPDQARNSALGKAALAAEALIKEMVFGKKGDDSAAGPAGVVGPVGPAGSIETADVPGLQGSSGPDDSGLGDSATPETSGDTPKDEE